MARAQSDGSIILSTKIDTSGLTKGMAQAQEKANGLTKTFSKLGTAITSVFAVQKIIQFSRESANFASQTEASVQRLVDIYGTASDEVGDFIDKNARALGVSKSAAASFSSIYGNLFSVWADQETNANLTNKYLQMTAVLSSKTGRTVEDVQERIRSGLLGNTEAIEDLGVFVNVKTIEMTDAFQRMANGKSWEQLDAYTQQQIRSMAILEQATAKYGDEIANTSVQVGNEFKAVYQDFQNTWGQIVNQVLMPILKVLTEVLNIANAGLGALLGKSQKILGNAENIADSSGETADNIEEQVENQKAFNKELGKSLAGFDDLQILSANSSNSTSSTSSSLDALNIPSVSSDSGTIDDTTSKVNTTLAQLMEVIGGALAAIGVIMLFLGQIPWGIGFIIAGAALFAVSKAALSDSPDTKSMKATLADIGKVIGGALAAIGVIMLFLGQIPWGIGFIIAGAALFAVSATEPKKTDTDKSVIARLSEVADVAGKSLIAIGLLLLFLGQIPWGIGFIVAGAGLVSVSEVDPTSDPDEFKESCDAILSFLAGVSAYLVTYALLSNWQKFVNLWGDFRALLSLIKTEGFLKTITSLFGSSLNTIQLWAIAMGVIVGAISYFSANWDKLSPAQRIITMLVSLAAALGAAAIAVSLFHASWSVGVAAAAIAGGIALLAGTYLFKNYNSKSSSSSNENTAPSSISQYAYLADSSTYKLPALAQGAVLPANKPFLAMVGDQKRGTNIEAPAELIKQMAKEAMLEMGVTGQGREVIKEEHYYLDKTELMRILYELVQGGERLNGTSLVKGGMS